MTGKQKEIAARHVIRCMFRAGYIDDRKRRELVFKLDSGDSTVLREVREYLLKIADNITK